MLFEKFALITNIFGNQPQCPVLQSFLLTFRAGLLDHVYVY